MNLINLDAPYVAEEARQEGVDPLEEYLTRPVRCKRCGETLSCNHWVDGAAEGCEDPDCPMKEYEP